MRGALRSLATGLGALALLACESVRTGANPEVPMWAHRPSWSMDVLYRRSIVAQSRPSTYERGQPEIDVTGRRLFVGSSDRGLYALSAPDGTQLWRFETLGFVQCAPLYDPVEDVVYFGSNDGALYKVNASTGQLLWRFMSNAEVSRRPVLEAGRIYAVNANDTVLALDAATGKLIWTQHRTPAMAMEIAGYAGPLVWRGKVYAAFSNGSVTAFDAVSGEERWQPVDLAAEAEQFLGQLPDYLDVDTTPVADVTEAGPVVFVGSYAGGVVALEADSGMQIWSNPEVGGVVELLLWQEPAHPSRTGHGPDSPARKMLIAATGTTGLWGLDPDTGQELWRSQLPRGGVSAPVPILGTLMFSGSQLGVFLVSPLDGTVIDGIHLADGVSATPAAYGRRAFVVTNTGSLLSLYVNPPI